MITDMMDGKYIMFTTESFTSAAYVCMKTNDWIKFFDNAHDCGWEIKPITKEQYDKFHKENKILKTLK